MAKIFQRASLPPQTPHKIPLKPYFFPGGFALKPRNIPSKIIKTNPMKKESETIILYPGVNE